MGLGVGAVVEEALSWRVEVSYDILSCFMSYAGVTSRNPVFLYVHRDHQDN